MKKREMPFFGDCLTMLSQEVRGTEILNPQTIKQVDYSEFSKITDY